MSSSVFEKWHSLATGPKKVADDGGSNEEEDTSKRPSDAELAALRLQTQSLYAILQLFKWAHPEAVGDSKKFARSYLKSYNDPDSLKTFTFDDKGKKTLWDELKKRLLTKLNTLSELDTTNDYVIVANLRSARMELKIVPHSEMLQYSFSIDDGIELHKKIVLFSTADIVEIERLYASKTPETTEQITYFRTRNISDLATLDGKLDSAKRIPQTHAGLPLASYLSDVRKDTIERSKEGDRPIGIVARKDAMPMIFNEISDVNNNFTSKEEVNQTYNGWKMDPEFIFVLDMRPDYFRARGWEPALLVWAGDEPRAKSRALPKQDVLEPRPQPRRRPTGVLLGSFEKGTNRMQSKLNEMYRERVPAVDTATNVASEVLRVAVLAYQLAFEAPSLDENLQKIAGVTSEGVNVYTNIIVPSLNSAEIDSSQQMPRTKNNLAKIDKFLASVVESNEQFLQTEEGRRSVLPGLSTNGKRLEGSFDPYLLYFFWKYFLQPLGPMSRDEMRLRALLKARQLGRIPQIDMQLFTYAEKILAAGDEKEKFNQLTDEVEHLARVYVDNERMFTPPLGTPPSEVVLFTRDFREAHEYAVRRNSKELPLRLAEIFDIMADRAELMYGDQPLSSYLFNKSRKRTASFYYTLKAGLFPGPPARDIEERQNFVFTYVVRSVLVATTTHSNSEDDDGDGVPDHEHGTSTNSDDMGIDAHMRNPEKYALFAFKNK